MNPTLMMKMITIIINCRYLILIIKGTTYLILIIKGLSVTAELISIQLSNSDLLIIVASITI